MATVREISLHYNTVYAVETAGGRILIDTGPDYRGAWEELQEAISRAPDLVIATHGHIDHASLGARWQAAGVPVAVGSDDVGLVEMPALHRPGELQAMEAYATSAGAPPEVEAEMIGGLRRRHGWAAKAASDTYPPGGSSDRWPTPLRFEQFTPRVAAEQAELPLGLEVIISPGHTPGNLVVFAAGEGWLFSGDQLLPDITPTPAIQAGPHPAESAAWRFRSLPAFLASLQHLAALQPEYCYPGHGESFTNVRERIDANIAAIEQRTDKVLAAIHDLGNATPWALCEALYRRAAGRRPWQILSTIQGHLDLLESRHQVHQTPTGWTT